MVVRRNPSGDAPSIHHQLFADFLDLPAPGDLVVRNTTRVWPARLYPTRPSGARAELLLIHPSSNGDWVALGKPGTALRPGKRLSLPDGAAIEVLEVLDNGERVVRFHGITGTQAMARYGNLPLPPYITRATTPEDTTRYQTVYAQEEGSVAAPTAGLHFTSAMFDTLQHRQVDVGDLTLDVGPGTFRPMDTDDPTAHQMHPEQYHIPPPLAESIQRTRERRGTVWAVGTTVVRALETAGRGDGTVKAGSGTTDLMITPGYPLKVADHLLTNFHLPRSTLLMLVAGFIGLTGTQVAYAEAVRARYQFYSYGDAMVIV